MLIRKISKCIAAVLVYIMCAYGYLTTKGFVYDGNHFILSNNAEAWENSEFQISEDEIRGLGNPNSPLTMYTISAVTCSHCRDFHKFTLPKLERDFISKGLLRFVYIHFPADETTMRAAKLSYCLPKDKFYDFIADLYDSRDWQFSRNEAILENHAKKFGMTDADIEQCKQDKKITSDLLRIRENAFKAFHITATPTIVVKTQNGEDVVEFNGYDELKQYLNTKLSQ